MLGEWGLTDTRLINECLLAKWIIKIDIAYDDMCCSLLKKMYLKKKRLLLCKFQWWISILERLASNKVYLPEKFGICVR
jgi:hypothetical protein